MGQILSIVPVIIAVIYFVGFIPRMRNSRITFLNFTYYIEALKLRNCQSYDFLAILFFI